MKKNLLFLLALTFIFNSSVMARTIYDTSNRIKVDGTIRGQKKASEQKIYSTTKLQAAAAAKINYDKALKELEDEGNLKPNYYQIRTAK